MTQLPRSRFLRLAPWLFVLTVLGALTAEVRAQPMNNVFARNHVSLNGKWETIVDPYDTGYFDYRYRRYDAAEKPWGGFFLDRTPQDKSELIEYAFGAHSTLLVPRDWNSQDEQLLIYEGSVWYRRQFDHPASAGAERDERRWFVYFGAANYTADVYLNGAKLGQHTGGFTPFQFEVTDALRDTGNTLIVRVNNERRRDGVPTLNTDWWNYGGITRDVLLVSVPTTFVSEYTVQLAPDADAQAGTIEVSVQLDGAERQQPVRVSIPELNVHANLTPNADGLARGQLTAAKLERWSPENPRRYEVIIESGTDRVSEWIGFRTVRVRGAEIVLNGEPVFLRGICIHEENPLRGGRAFSREDAHLLLGWARELGCNFVRLAHYPHNEHMARVADELGLLVWEEIPVYWTIEWDNPETLANARQQLTELITRDRNRASVIIWSVANETPVSEPRTRFMKTLVDHARALDPTRLISAAMEVHSPRNNPDLKIVDDPFGQYTDIISFNQYVGWYDGLPEKCDRVRWQIAYEKPVIISEFGADALAGLHGDALTRFSEEYQEDLYRRTIPMLERIPTFSGMTPWILADFRSPRRLLPGVQDGWNRKGLVGENGERKKAFFVLQEYYQKKAAAAAAD